MAVSTYAITVPQADIALAAPQGASTPSTAQFSVNVQNVQTVPDRVVVAIEAAVPRSAADSPPPRPAESGWFTIEDHLRDIPAGGSEKFLVSVSVPATVAGGSYRLQPVAYSADHPPDDTKVTGPAMTVGVPSRDIPPPPWWKRWWPWWLVAAVAAVLLIVAVVVLVVVLGRDDRVTVPDERGKPLAAAETDLKANNLSLGNVTRQVDTTVAPDTVLAQTPPPGDKIDPGSAINLTVADKVSGALRFDGGRQVATVSGPPALSTGFSVQATVKPAESGQASSFSGLVRGAIESGGGAWVLFVQDSTWGLSVCTPICNAARAPLEVGQQRVLSGTYDGQTIAIFQDGVQVASAPLTGVVSPFSTVQIGRWASSFNGVIDDVALWGTALPPEQVLDAARQIPVGPQPNLVGLWRFDEGSDQQIFDSSGGGRTGFLGETPTADAGDPERVPGLG